MALKIDSFSSFRQPHSLWTTTVIRILTADLTDNVITPEVHLESVDVPDFSTSVKTRKLTKLLLLECRFAALNFPSTLMLTTPFGLMAVR